MHGIAFVTGAARGIGRAIALALAEGGFDVAANDLEPSGELALLCDEIIALGRKAVPVIGDVGDLDQHRAMLETGQAALGPLTTLVNNAGVSVLNRGDLLDVSSASYDRCMAINAKGTFFLTQAFAKHLLTRERPASIHHSIVTVSSANAIAASIARGEYCMSKAAVSMSSKLFAARLSNDGIGVYEIQPGFIETEMTAPAKARYDAMIEGGITTIRRWGQPKEVARIALTLASGLLPYTSGQAIAADGGLLTVRY